MSKRSGSRGGRRGKNRIKQRPEPSPWTEFLKESKRSGLFSEFSKAVTYQGESIKPCLSMEQYFFQVLSKMVESGVPPAILHFYKNELGPLVEFWKAGNIIVLVKSAEVKTFCPMKASERNAKFLKTRLLSQSPFERRARNEDSEDRKEKELPPRLIRQRFGFVTDTNSSFAQELSQRGHGSFGKASGL